MMSQVEELDAQSESFIKAEKEIQSTEYATNGLARLTQANVVEAENVPKEYNASYTKLGFEKYIIFKANIAKDKEITVVMPPGKSNSLHKGVLNWTQEDSIGELSNKTIPVKKIKNDVYVPYTLTSKYENLNVDEIKEFISIGYIKYDESNDIWTESNKYKRYKRLIYTLPLIGSILPSIIVYTITPLFTNNPALIGGGFIATMAISIIFIMISIISINEPFNFIRKIVG